MVSSAAHRAAAAAGRFGKLWGRGHETFPASDRRILSVSGPGATKYLQGLVTCDLLSDPPQPREEYDVDSHAASVAKRAMEAQDATPPQVPDVREKEVPVRFDSRMRSACFLDHRGRIVTDALLWKRPVAGALEPAADPIREDEEVEYLIDVAGDAADGLLTHLKKYKLRKSKVKIGDKSEEVGVHAVYGTLNAEGTPPGYAAAMDPRHPALGMRVLSVGTDGDNLTPSQRSSNFESMMSNFFPPASGTYSVIRKLSGVAEGREISGKTALECNQEFMGSVSFHKGCYLGQELTARSQHTGQIRKRILPVAIIDNRTEVPRPWVLADMIQELGPDKLGENLFGTPDEGMIDIGLDLGDYVPPPLPRVSATGVGGIFSMLLGSALPFGAGASDGAGGPEISPEEEEEMRELREAGEKLLGDVSAVAVRGAKIVDEKDGKTIGQILSPPASGTTVVLAQMRLDRVGLAEGGEPWSRNNTIRIGEGTGKMRYLPYLPLWWPEIDRATGKAKEEE